MQVSHDAAAGTFTLTGKIWSNTYPIEQLDAWLRFYVRQRDDHPKALDSYDATISGLEALSRGLRDRT